MAATLQQRVAMSLGLPVSSVHRLARSAPYRYKVYTIPKRSGSGLRVIAQPAREVKVVQRWLVENELSTLPIHDAATAYRTGCSIRGNAELHVAQRFLLKLDFSSFFPSIKESALKLHLERYCSNRYRDHEIGFLLRMLLWYAKDDSHELELCIGAPSSPLISNSIVYELDELISQRCSAQGIVYSRYADDLAFSTNTPDLLRDIPAFLRRTLRAIPYPAIALNEKKTIYTSKKFHRSVTGVVLSSQGGLSLGRERKRLIRSMTQKAKAGLLPASECAHLRGLMGFALDIEPAFVERLARKYGGDCIEVIRRFELPKAEEPF